MRRLIPLVFVACTSSSAPDASVAVAPPPLRETTHVDPIAKGVPHGGQIEQVAVTEQADAALTFDTVGGVRLWPALDGTRAPVPVPVVAPRQLALTHAGSDLLAAVLDEAGGVRLLRLGRDGSLRGDVQLGSDVAYAQVIALGDGVLARSIDQRVAWFAADGTSRGTLASEPGTRVQAIAARQDGAIAVTTNGTKHALRWLHTFAGELAWGSSVALPTAVQDEAIALSPSHRRIAIVDDRSMLAVYDIGLVPVRIGDTLSAARSDVSLGFIDDDHVAVIGGSTLQWWSMPSKRPEDPWAVAASPALPVPSRMQSSDAGASGNGVAVTGFGAALALSDKEHVRYLGYKEQGVGNLGAAPSSLWLSISGSNVVWLDDKLAAARDVEMRQSPDSPWIYAVPVGDHHVATQQSVNGKYQVQLVDIEHRDHPIDLGTYGSVDRIEPSPDGHLLAVAVYGTVHRFALDLAANSVRELPELKVRGSLVSVRLLDPARADGMTAISIGWDHEWDESYTLTVYREHGAPKKLKRLDGRVIDIDATGTVYLVVGNEIQIRHGEKKLASFKLERIGSAVAVTADGSRFAVQDGNDIVVVDRTGAEQWRRSLWGAAQLVFTHDGTHLAARANGGIVMFDAATGEPGAVECGWSFGMMTTPPMTNALASAPVCEDPIL
jgi:hypothetical protein